MTLHNSRQTLTPDLHVLRAAVYVRVSTDRQAEEGVSLDVQREACARFARGNGYVLGTPYVDDESSFAPRQEYQRMLADAVEGRFDAVLCYDFSRFGRSLETTPADIGRLERMGVKVVAVTAPNAGRLERGIQWVINEHYSYELGKKVKPSHIKRVQDGLWVNRPPVGYVLEPAGEARPGRKSPKRLAVDPDAGPKVTHLFELFSAGTYSLNAIARQADAMGLRSHSGRPLARSHIAHLLRNPAYVGKVVYNRRSLSKFEKRGPRPQSEWVEAQGQHTPLVNYETFRKCQEILDRHRRSYGDLTRGRPLLTGVAYCGQCGGKMTGRGRWKVRPAADGTISRSYFVTYQCFRAWTYRDCDRSHHGGKGLEEWVKAQLRCLPITQEEREAARAEVKRMARDGRGDIDLQRRRLQEEREAHQADLKALTWRLVREEIPASVYAEMRAEKEQAIAGLDRNLADLDKAQELDSRAEQALALLDGITWDDFDGQAWKEAIAVLVQRVVVTSRGDYGIEWQPGVAELLRKRSS